jgi:organic hydroperoxide reductase OsmC/OhrA
MTEFTATVHWARNGAVFTDNKYSRGHEWRFDGGAVVPGSSAPHSVPLPYSVESAVDPEEAFVAALASCHMLFFLAYAAKGGFVVDDYSDAAIGIMAKNDEGRIAMTKVTLRPAVRYVGSAPDRSAEMALHDKAHHACYIANSVKSEVVVEPR